MTSQERVRAAIHFKGSDRIPHYLPDGKDNDIEWLWIPKPTPMQDWRNEGDIDTMTDCWGTKFYRMKGGVIGRGEVLEPAIRDIRRQADYVLPDLHRAELLKEAAARVAATRQSANPKYCLGVMPCGSLNEGTHNLMTLEAMFVAYYESPDDLKAFINRLAAKQKESIRLLHELGCDGVMSYDDWGLQNRLMVKPEMIEEFFMPHYRANWAYAHSLGMDVWLHSCGYIIDLLPTLAEAGLNVIQQDQQENMGVENLAAKVGGRLAFWCPVDIQKTMIEGSLDDIRAYAKRLISTLGAFNGGYISMAYSTPKDVNHTPEKLAAMCEAFRRWEKLPLKGSQ
jgi:uroporphyrinogen decarboxylase